MSIFDMFRRKSGKSISRASEVATEDWVFESNGDDHLGKGVAVGNKAKCAVKARRYDEAWKLLHEQKQHYLQHAKRYGMTPRQAICLDGSVHEDLANILRLEGKYDDALVHMLYCVISSVRPTKSHDKKIAAYFNRCRFANLEKKAMDTFIHASRSSPDFVLIQSTVKSWRSK